MASQPPHYGGQDQQYQAYQPHVGQDQHQQSGGFHHGEGQPQGPGVTPHIDHNGQTQPQSGPGVNAPLLSFNEGSGRYEAPAPGGGFGGEHEGGYQVPSGAPPQHHGGGFGGEHQGGFQALSGAPPQHHGGGFGGEQEGQYQVPGSAPPQHHGGGFGGEHEGQYQAPSGVPPQRHGEQLEGGHGAGFEREHEGRHAGAAGMGGGFGGGHQAGSEVPPGLPPRRTGTAAALPQGQDRSHQVEVMQSYEMSRPQTEDEQNQAILQREFPKMDSSLIAAIYGDSGSLSATRELLQELDAEGK